MSRSRHTNVHRSQNRPSRPSFAAQSQLLLRHTRLPDSTVVSGTISARMAGTLVCHGQGEDEHMLRLAYALNMSMLLCDLKILPEDLPAVVEAQEALMIAHSHSHAMKRWVIQDAQFEIICRALSIYERQLAMASQAQVIAADCELVGLQASGEVCSPSSAAATATATLASVV